MKKLPILLLSILLGCTFFACDDLDDHYSSNPTHRLDFSTHLLSFDTIFSTIGSTTKQFMIYNRNSEALNIESILLAGAQETGFRINVDGRKGDSFKNIAILAKDSMYVFVEVTVNPNGTNQPLMIQDSVVFFFNGIKQSVVLEAYGQDVNLYKGGSVITNNTTLTAEKPYLIYDSLTIAKDAVVTIEKGATFYMHDRAKINVEGTLNAVGTKDQPITFRGDRLDFILNDVLPYDRTPGQWGGLFFKSESFDNILDHVIVRNGTTGIFCEQSLPDRSKLKIDNSQITNMDGNLLSAVNCNVEVINSELTNATGAVSSLIGGSYRFIHCTLANFMTLKTRSSSHSLLLSNILPGKDKDNDQTFPLTVSFDNCIIDGNHAAGTESLKGELSLKPADGMDFNYRFNHCVIKTVGENNDDFISSFFVKTGPSYTLLGGEKNKYVYNFRLDSATTVGVGKADPEITKLYPVDRDGTNRLTSTNGPTIGVYEYVPVE